MDLWLFGCRYHLKDFLLKVEDLVQSNLFGMGTALQTDSARMQKLPSDSKDVALSSFARMLRRTIRKCSDMHLSCTVMLCEMRNEDPDLEYLLPGVRDELQSCIQFLNEP